MKGFRKFVPALALAGALLAGSLPGSVAKAQSAVFSSGFQVQNLSSVGARISIAFFPEGGTVATDTVAGNVPANGQTTYAVLPAEVDAGFKGSAVISSDQRIAAIVNLVTPNLGGLINGTAGAAGASYVGVTGGSRSVSLPLLFRASFGFNTFFSVQNVGATPTQVTVTYSGGGLTAPTTQQATIQPGASARFDQATNTALPTGFNGAATIASTASDIAAVVTQVGPTTALTYNGFSGGSTNPVFPLVSTNNFNFVTGISLQNLGTASTTVDVTYSASDSAYTCVETQTIAPKATGFFAINAFARDVAGETCRNGTPAAGPNFVGSARVTRNTGNVELVAIVNQLNSRTNKGGSYGAFDPADASQTVVFPLIQDRVADFFTGISLVNTSSVASPIECTYSGTTIKQTSPAPIPPGGSYTINQFRVLTAGYNGSGTCRATTSGATLVGVANQLRAVGVVDALFVYEGTNVQ